MVGHLSIRTKLRIGLGAMAISVAILFAAAMYGLYSYRGLVKSLAARATELPLADTLGQHVSNLRVILAHTGGESLQLPSIVVPDETVTADSAWKLRDAREQYRIELDNFADTLGDYRKRLAENAAQLTTQIGDDHPEQHTLEEIDRLVERIEGGALDEAWLLGVPAGLEDDVEALGVLVSQLPSHLHGRMSQLSTEVASRYRFAIIVAYATCAGSVALMVWGIEFFRRTITHPLSRLMAESERIAGGDFEHHIESLGPDEIGQLGRVLNAMTRRFREIRDDLDEQVKKRSQEVIRSEQLASVGFLAAGVAHEINNPLASIALCSESLEGRLAELIDGADKQRPEWEIISSYLEMIQREAFRCKQITEKLLDFSRMGDSQRHPVELRELVTTVIEMVQHLGRYGGKTIELVPGDHLVAEVNAQEIKQVVLNLITNGLDSLDAGGRVAVAIERAGEAVRIVVADNGCGMTDEVRRHLFEPFFTRRREGQGTGLGLSISYRIIEEHGGTLRAESAGVGQGSKFIVELPAQSLGVKRRAA